MKFLLKTVVVIVVVFVIGGIIIGLAANSVSDADKKAGQQLEQVQIGDTKAQVRSAAGEPDNIQTFNNSGIGETECWYYEVSHQVCFDNQGRVEAVNNY